MGIHAHFILPQRRTVIEGEIEMHLQRVEMLLARLDRFDNPDEDMEDDDPAGDWLDEKGEAQSDTGANLLPLLPLYMVDQTQGPTNEVAGYRAWQRSAGSL